jgi:hypothetical protein
MLCFLADINSGVCADTGFAAFAVDNYKATRDKLLNQLASYFYLGDLTVSTQELNFCSVIFIFL